MNIGVSHEVSSELMQSGLIYIIPCTFCHKNARKQKLHAVATGRSSNRYTMTTAENIRNAFP